MKHNSWVRIPFFLVFLLYMLDNQAQTMQKNYDLKWNNPINFTFSDNHNISVLNFDGAIYTQKYTNLPTFYEKVIVDKNFDFFSVQVIAQEFEEIPKEEANLIPEDFHSKNLEIDVVAASERNVNYALISFVPIIESSEGKYSRLKTIKLAITGKESLNMRGIRDYAAQSVLANGQWFTFTIAETGIYKITHQDLIAMGMTDPINSAQISIFGNGGWMLPEANSAKRVDDLQEIPISIVDGGDGKIDDNDYILFYGRSPHTIKYDTAQKFFSHSYNVYSTTSTYFVTQTSGVGEKKRIQQVNYNNFIENQTVNDYVYFDFYEKDLFNVCESGNDWFGDRYDITLSRDYSFALPSAPIGDGRISVRGASTASLSSVFTISVNQNTIGNIVLVAPNSSSIARMSQGSLPFSSSSKDLKVNINYNKPTTSAASYLDWIEVEAICKLLVRNGQTTFRNPNTVGDGNITKFNIESTSDNLRVWDVTNLGEIFQYELQADANIRSFKANTDILREFVAFDGTSYKSIAPSASVSNQNLHSINNVDMVIVAHPNFMEQANRLAKFRTENDGLSVCVVTPQQIYNEFSSGSQDPIAIRDFVKMIYDRSNKEYPKYLLLLGRPSYDYRGIAQGTSIYVPNYQYFARNNNISEYYLYSNDDTFGLLDDNEGENAAGLYDIAIGRIPCSLKAQANTAVEKSIRYTEKKNLISGQTQISNFGDWRNMMAFVADDENSNDFVVHADKFTRIVAENNENINFDKIYLDAYQQVSNAGGQRYPEAVTDINNRMNRGALFFTYIGHSGKDGWAAERVLENSDISKWTNKYNMPILLSLSCTFGYYDRQALSPSDLIYFNNNGGAAAVISATREAWSSPNNRYGEELFSIMFNDDFSEENIAVGDLNRIAKNRYGGGQTNLAMFVVFGDPSMRLSAPKYKVITDSVNNIHVSNLSDTLRALSKVTVCGHIENHNNQILNDFNGVVYPSVYDKKLLTQTLANDPESEAFEYTVQKSVLFKGNVTVKNGYFRFSFFIPKDIDYDYGNGKISYYACNDKEDAAGAFSEFIIGGTDTLGIKDSEKPKIELYLNDESFVDGGVTHPNPVLIAKISDNYGINTTGNGIGHDLSAVLDNSVSSKIILNDYYETEKDSFNRGVVRYNLQDLEPGDHVISVRAWDINNNSSEQQLHFKVSKNTEFELSHVLNYPNPFTTHTDFYFEHNQAGGVYDIKVQIYTISGKIVRTLFDNQYIEGSRSRAISWDGLDDFGDRLAKGTYIYRITVRNQDNKTAETIEKLVIL